MPIDLVIPCAPGANTSLLQVLPQALALFDSVTVLTPPGDHTAAKLAACYGAEIYVSAAWSESSAKMRAAALNEWIDRATTYEPDQWLLVVEPDILLLDSPASLLLENDPRGLYTLPCGECARRALLAQLLAGEFDPSQLPRSEGPYLLQMWCPMRAAGRLRYPLDGPAGTPEMIFAASFPEALRHELPGRGAVRLRLVDAPEDQQ